MNNWISVKDRLPEKNGAYLVVVRVYITDKPYIKLLYFMTNLKLHPEFRYDESVANGQSGWWDGDGEGDWIVHGVTHWMELPELPEDNSSSIKLCPKCGGLSFYNSYFGRYICNKCSECKA